MVTGASEVHTDPGGSRVTDPNTASSCSPGLYIVIAPGTCYSGLYGLVCIMALGYQHGSKLLIRLGQPTRPPLVATGVTDVGCCRATDPDMALVSSSAWISPWPHVSSRAPPLAYSFTIAPGDKQASSISLLLTVFISSVLSLPTAHEPFYFSFSPISPPHLVPC